MKHTQAIVSFAVFSLFFNTYATGEKSMQQLQRERLIVKTASITCLLSSVVFFGKAVKECFLPSDPTQPFNGQPVILGVSALACSVGFLVRSGELTHTINERKRKA
jgi:hypothetical protein